MVTTETQTVESFFNELEENIKITQIEEAKMKRENLPAIRDCTNLPYRKGVRQGDIYIIRVNEGESDILYEEKNTRQLAPGNSVGASHVVMDSPHVKLYKHKPKVMGNRLEIQVGFLITSTVEFTILHKKHAWDKFSPGHYEVWYQIDAITKERAKD